jgi:hypothetical protein
MNPPCLYKLRKDCLICNGCTFKAWELQYLTVSIMAVYSELVYRYSLHDVLQHGSEGPGRPHTDGVAQ